MELFTKLGLKEICYIVNKMGLSTNVQDFVVEDLKINGIRYRYEKHGNQVFITDENNKQLRISINYTEVPGKDHLNRDIIVAKHEIAIDLLLEDGEYINLYNEIGLPGRYEGFENVQRHDLMSNIRTKYCDRDGNKIASFSLGLEKICLNETDMYEFTNEGIVTGRKKLSTDGKVLVSINGDKAQDRSTLELFNLEDEKAKIDRIINENKDLHEYTITALQSAKVLLERRDRSLAPEREFYKTGIDESQKAIAIRERLISSIEKCTLDVEGLEGIARDFFSRKFEATPKMN